MTSHLTDAQKDEIRARHEKMTGSRWPIVVETLMDDVAALLSEMKAMAAQRELLAAWMMRNSYATGHGDSVADLLAELDPQHKARAEAAESQLSTLTEELAEANSKLSAAITQGNQATFSLASLTAQMEKVTGALKAAEEQFMFYASQHLAKSPPDTIKAEVNAVWARRCNEAATPAKPSSLPEAGKDSEPANQEKT